MADAKKVLVLTDDDGVPYDVLLLDASISKEAIEDFMEIMEVMGEASYLFGEEILHNETELSACIKEKWDEQGLIADELPKLIEALKAERYSYDAIWLKKPVLSVNHFWDSQVMADFLDRELKNDPIRDGLKTVLTRLHASKHQQVIDNLQAMGISARFHHDRLEVDLETVREAFGSNPCKEVLSAHDKATAAIVATALGKRVEDMNVGKISGRWSCKEPNLQEIPKGGHFPNALYEELPRPPNGSWDHFGEPFEIQAIDGGPLKDDKEAQAKHREECGCSWPEFDYHAAFHAWWNLDLSPLNSITGAQISEMLVIAQRSTFGDYTDVIKQKLSRILDLADQFGIGKVVQAAQGSIRLLKDFELDRKAGIIGPFQFGDAETDGRLALETKRDSWTSRRKS
jgi:hypothetical protein